MSFERVMRFSCVDGFIASSFFFVNGEGMVKGFL